MWSQVEHLLSNTEMNRWEFVDFVTINCVSTRFVYLGTNVLLKKFNSVTVSHYTSRSGVRNPLKSIENDSFKIHIIFNTSLQPYLAWPITNNSFTIVIGHMFKFKLPVALLYYWNIMDVTSISGWINSTKSKFTTKRVVTTSKNQS